MSAPLFEQPADAPTDAAEVHVGVDAEMEEHFVEANERLGEALVGLNVAMGLKPGAPAKEAHDRATELWTGWLHYRALRLALRLLLERGAAAAESTLSIYGPGDQEIVDQVRELVAPSARRPTACRPLSLEGWFDYVVLPMAHGTPQAVVLPEGWVMIPEATTGSQRVTSLFED